MTEVTKATVPQCHLSEGGAGIVTKMGTKGTKWDKKRGEKEKRE